jgi:phytoene synthase
MNNNKISSKTLVRVIKKLPKAVRDDVSKLYSFFDFVYSVSHSESIDSKRFERIYSRWGTIKKQLIDKNLPTPLNDSIDEQALANIAYVIHRYKADVDWVDAFLSSMKMDVKGRVYKTDKELLEYLYGSSEVVGLIMVKILKLPGQGIGAGKPEAEVFRLARIQARVIKYRNIFLDIEGSYKNMHYIPLRTIKKHGLTELNPKIAQSQPEIFQNILNEQKSLLELWNSEAKGLVSYLPERYQLLISTI